MKIVKKLFPFWIGAITFCLILLLFFFMGYAPFGDNSLARSDANVQYLDFFAYLKELLAGHEPVGYSFGKVLGGNNIGIISYYLLSPFNLLVVLFDKTNLHSFIDIIAALKIGLTACTMSFFLKQRFLEKLSTYSTRQYVFISLFGMSYALSQWCISQSSNVMWLDGAYMLPLVLLGTYKLTQGKNTWLLSLTAGLSIIFNWYSGGINCLFSFVWLLFELFNQYTDSKKIPWHQILQTIIKYCFAMLLAVMISALVILPTFEVMSGTDRGQFEIAALFDPSFRGNVVTALQTYCLGAVSSETAVTLFCGSLVLIGIIGCFITKEFNLHKKIIYAVLLIVLLLFFYWNPGFMLFSLLKSANSFWYRYAYVAIFALIFMSADFFLHVSLQKIKVTFFIFTSLTYATILLLLNYINPELSNLQYTYYSIIFFSLIAILSFLAKSQTSRLIFLILIVIGELTCGTILQMKRFHTEDVSAFKDYTILTEQQINAIKSQDDSSYRISQTTTRNQTADNLTANYNEPLAYDYWSITGYTSNPDEKQMTFLDKVGYLTGSVNMNIVDTSLIGVDSLLGVKYIISPYSINGLQKTNITTGYDNKKVYLNPYALPIAFKYQTNDYNLDTETWTGMNSINPFEYQNRLFKKITNTDISIYQPVNSSLIKNADKLIYHLDIPNGNYALYANIPWKNPIPSRINLNNVHEMGYAMWLSPSALYVPTKAKDTTATITIKTTDPDNFKIGEEQFYVLNLNALQNIKNQASLNQPDTNIIKDGYAYFEVNANNDREALFTSIPIDPNWTIRLNGQPINPESFADLFYVIPLSTGHNTIEMVYTIDSLVPSLILSVFGIVTLIGIQTYQISLKKRHL